MQSEEVHAKLASQNIRIFKIELEPFPKDECFWIHHNKTVDEWRKDLNSFLEKGLVIEEQAKEGYADSGVLSRLYHHMHDLGYHEVDDVISDIYEGRITNEAARIVDDPDHEEQTDGFGHYGWESK